MRRRGRQWRELLRTGQYEALLCHIERCARRRDTHKKSSQRQALKNISAILDAAGSGLQNVVKVNIFLTTMDDFAAMNEAYDEFFTWDPKPVSIYVPWICPYPCTN